MSLKIGKDFPTIVPRGSFSSDADRDIELACRSKAWSPFPNRGQKARRLSSTFKDKLKTKITQPSAVYLVSRKIPSHVWRPTVHQSAQQRERTFVSTNTFSCIGNAPRRSGINVTYIVQLKFYSIVGQYLTCLSIVDLNTDRIVNPCLLSVGQVNNWWRVSGERSRKKKRHIEKRTEGEENRGEVSSAEGGRGCPLRGRRHRSSPRRVKASRYGPKSPDAEQRTLKRRAQWLRAWLAAAEMRRRRPSCRPQLVTEQARALLRERELFLFIRTAAPCAAADCNRNIAVCTRARAIRGGRGRERKRNILRLPRREPPYIISYRGDPVRAA